MSKYKDKYQNKLLEKKSNNFISIGKLSLSLSLALSLSMLGLNYAQAVDIKTKGAYIDVSIGAGKVDEKILGASNKNSGFAWNANLGYFFNQNLAAEVGYMSFPQVKSSNTVYIKDNYAIDLALKGKFYINDKTGVYAKAGIAYVSSKYENTSAVGISAQVADGAYRKVTGLFGAGINYYVNDNTYIGVDGALLMKKGQVPEMSIVGLNFGYVF